MKNSFIGYIVLCALLFFVVLWSCAEIMEPGVSESKVNHSSGTAITEANISNGVPSNQGTETTSPEEPSIHEYCSTRMGISDLSHRDLSGTNLSCLDLRDANLVNVNLSSTILSDIDMRGASLHYANLSNAILSNRVYLSNASLYTANLTGANLRGVNLSYVDLTRANFANADLTDANLSYTETNGIILTDAIGLNTVNWTGARR